MEMNTGFIPGCYSSDYFRFKILWARFPPVGSTQLRTEKTMTEAKGKSQTTALGFF